MTARTPEQMRALAAAAANLTVDNDWDATVIADVMAALRAAADQLETAQADADLWANEAVREVTEKNRLSAELAISENRTHGYEEVVAGLRAVIQNAPHDVTCATPAESLLGAPRDSERPCTCWKADVL